MLKRHFLYLSLVAVVIMVPLGAPAQTYFDFGSTAFVPRNAVPVVVFDQDQYGTIYTVATTVKDMVFDHNKEYSMQLMTQTFNDKYINGPTGLFHITSVQNKNSGKR